MNTDNELLKNLDELHTTELGALRIKRNLSLDIDTNDVIEWCKTKINSDNAIIRIVIRLLRHIRKKRLGVS